MTISVELSPALAFPVVSDTGEGIPAEKLNSIFEEFSQVQPSGTRRTGGTGLGLELTKRLVELQGGSITVQSDQGSGTVVKFTLKRDLIAAD